MLDDKERIVATLQLMHGGDVVEVRALKCGQYGSTWSGYFDDYELAAEAALEAEEAGSAGVYTLLNKLHGGVIARSPNIFSKRAAKTTTETDIVARNWLLVDFDPVRPSGISSTAEELGKAKLASKIVYDILSESTEGELIRACSGNGFHVLAPLTGKPDVGRIKKTLKILAANVSHIEGIDVDMSVTKLNQLTKLYGTKATKGFSTADRPHRTSYILTPNLERYHG